MINSLARQIGAVDLFLGGSFCGISAPNACLATCWPGIQMIFQKVLMCTLRVSLVRPRVNCALQCILTRPPNLGAPLVDFMGRWCISPVDVEWSVNVEPRVFVFGSQLQGTNSLREKAFSSLRESTLLMDDPEAQQFFSVCAAIKSSRPKVDWKLQTNKWPTCT